jgi:hypothetical protein
MFEIIWVGEGIEIENLNVYIYIYVEWNQIKLWVL